VSSEPEELIPYDLSADPEYYVRVPPGWAGFRNVLPRTAPDHPALRAARRGWELAQTGGEAGMAEWMEEQMAAFALMKDLFCGAPLLPLPPCPRDYFRGSGIAVHPAEIAYFDPLQGPQPARCAREPHPGSPWHWDGRGTWFR
jgi:hypothetical protein